MADMSLAEKIIRSESTEELKRIRNSMIEAFKSAEIVDAQYGILADELKKRGAL